MKINGIIYFFTPLESDFKNRKKLREHLARPTVGRLFLQKNEEQQWTIPFGSICHLIAILNRVHLKNIQDLDFTIEEKVYGNGFEKDNRRCFRISIIDANPQTDSSRYIHYLGKAAKEKLVYSDFSDNTIGALIQLDTPEDYKYHKVYFSNFFDAGIKLNKMFSTEVRKRISVEEIVNIPWDEED